MKIKTVVEIQTKSLAEEQFILTRFPEAYWVTGRELGKTTFYIDSKYTNKATKAVREWKEKTE